MLPRVLVLLLLLMNVGVGAWWFLRPEHEPRRFAPTEPAVPGLELLTELEARGAVGELAEAPQPIAPSPDAVCERIGPFLTQADLRRAVGALTPVVQRIQFRETRALARRGYWVYMPAQPTRDAALATARELAAQGLRDYYVVTAGDRQNTISLGLFRELANARQRQADVRAMGFGAELGERTEEIPQYWVDIAADPRFDWRAQLGGYAGVDSARIDCEA
ncbi:MAG: SPOR domain-containing protein [Lysobacterales bacterium]|jgi:hypothetical protein